MNEFQRKHCIPPAYRNQPAADGFVLGGIISFGKGCGRRGTPGVYTNLYQPAIRNWSLDKIKMFDENSIWIDQTKDSSGGSQVETTTTTTTTPQTMTVTKTKRYRKPRVRATRKPRPSWKQKRERKNKDRKNRKNRRRYV